MLLAGKPNLQANLIFSGCLQGVQERMYKTALHGINELQFNKQKASEGFRFSSAQESIEHLEQHFEHLYTPTEITAKILPSHQRAKLANFCHFLIFNDFS